MFHQMDTFCVRDINNLPCAGVISFGICSSTIFVSLSLSRKPGVIAPKRNVFNSCANAYIIFNPSVTLCGAKTRRAATNEPAEAPAHRFIRRKIT
uniref:Uncharacterized protein n=1 Tax=Parascaris equorum TaxID=6256 RepID=A0A914RZ67_PAREQ